MEPFWRPSPYAWKDEKVISSQHGFIKEKKMYLTNLKASCDEMIGLVDKGRLSGYCLSSLLDKKLSSNVFLWKRSQKYLGLVWESTDSR